VDGIDYRGVMVGRTLRFAPFAALTLVLSACVPWWNGAGDSATVSGVTVSWPVPKETDASQEIAFYLVEVAGNLSATTSTSCTLVGLASNSSYSVRVTALDTNGEYSADIDPQYTNLGNRTVTVTTGAGSNSENNPRCSTNVDADSDGLPNLVESNTGTFVGLQDTGSNPNQSDTDGDGISDGDEVLGTDDGLDLPGLGLNPLRTDILLEFDWMDDDQSQMVGQPWYSPGGADGCGAHSHRPTAAVAANVTAMFANAPTSNPDGSTGINLVADYGQGGAFSGGNLVADTNGYIDGGVDQPEYLGHKSANFAANRTGYFHYVLMPHRYGGSNSSGQAELYGDDMIVSLYCYNSTTNVANTIAHELGHNLSLFHGGNTDANNKPNYNSVMNYDYQFPGIEVDCSGGSIGYSFGDGVLDFSTGSLAPLNESGLNESVGMCSSVPVDWNANGVIDPGTVSRDLNGSGLSVLTDYNDWANLYFAGIGDGDGARVEPIEIITEQPVPAEFESGQ
jgi:hypothetical protein